MQAMKTPKSSTRSLTVTNKLTILNVIVFMSGMIGIFGAFQIHKGAKLHELNIQHLNHIQKFKLEVDDFNSGKHNILQNLIDEILEIRKAPSDCLSQIKWIDRVVMKLAGTYNTILVCEQDLIIADNLLNAIDLHSNNSISESILKDRIKIAVRGFQKSSDEFQPLVADTVSLVFFATLTMFILKAIAAVLGGHFVSKSVAKDYLKLQNAFRAKEKAESELEEYQQQLEEQVEKRTRELALSNQKLLHSEKLNAVGKLSASFAHEFNNPLYGVQNVLEEIKEDVPMKESELQLVDIALSESKRMAKLIDKLKSFYKVTTDERILCEMHEVIEDMLTLQKYSLEENNIKVNLCFENGLPMIEIVPDQLKQVILNMLQNSQDAIGRDGGTIEVTTRTSQENIQICIEDSGCGISKDNCAMVFEPFYSTKGKANGAGLGLSVSYGIIKNHAGQISIDSEVGRGTKITITLPIKTNKHSQEAIFQEQGQT
jgi:signal transduction histidine kinase